MKSKTNIDFLKYRKFAFIISGVIILLGIILLLLRGGFNLGLDFQGGIRAVIAIETEGEEIQKVKVDEVRSLLASELPGIQVAERLDEANQFEITYKSSELEKRQTKKENTQSNKKYENGFYVKALNEKATEIDVEQVVEEAVGDKEGVNFRVESSNQDTYEVIPVQKTEDFNIEDFVSKLLEDEEKLGMEGGFEITEVEQEERRVNITQIVNEQVLPILRERFGEGIVIKKISEETEGSDNNIEQIVKNQSNKIEGLDFNLKEGTEYVFKANQIPDNYKLEDFITTLKVATALGEVENYELSEIVHSVQVDSFEPTVGRDIQNVAWAVAGLIILLILGYLALRFQFKFGVAAIIAVIHDSFIILAILAITGFEVGIQTVTAILTIIGYSLNDTIVVFDRIRENSENIKREEYMFVINKSINQVLGRTIITSITTLLAVLSLLIFGGPAIFELAFSISIGIVVGTYSSIFVASPILVIWENFLHKRQEKKEERKKQKSANKKNK